MAPLLTKKGDKIHLSTKPEKRETSRKYPWKISEARWLKNP